MQSRQLTRRAALTLVSRLLQQGARLVMQFVVTPILIRGLGVPLYGAWMMIQQSIGYLSLGDVRPMATLKFTLAVRQHIDDEEEKRRLVGAALYVTLYTFPLFLIIGSLLAWYSPSYIRVAPEYTWALRVATGIMVLQFVLDRLLTLPSNVLVGVNLDYRSMGSNAISVLASGLLTIAAIRMDLGLPGVAAAVAIGGVIHGTVRYVVARRAVSWFGFSRPTREELKAFTATSGWVAVNGLGALVLSSTDVLLIGIVLSPAAAAAYAATGAVLRFVGAPLTEALGAGTAGLGDLCGREEWSRVRRVRIEMHVVTIAAMSIIGSAVLALNRRFLAIWTKRDVYAGSSVNLWLVILTVLLLFSRIERVIATSMLQLRAQTLAYLIPGALAIAGGIIGVRRFGPVAMPIALSVAYLAILLITGRTIRARAGASPGSVLLFARPLVVAAMLFAVGAFLEPRIAPSNWIELIGYGALIGFVATAVTVTLGLGREARQMLLARVRGAMAAVRPSA